MIWKVRSVMIWVSSSVLMYMLVTYILIDLAFITASEIVWELGCICNISVHSHTHILQTWYPFARHLLFKEPLILFDLTFHFIDRFWKNTCNMHTQSAHAFYSKFFFDDLRYQGLFGKRWTWPRNSISGTVVHADFQTNLGTHIHRLYDAHIMTLWNTRTHTRRTHTPWHTYAHTHTVICTNAQIHARAHTHTHTYTQKHTQTY